MNSASQYKGSQAFAHVLNVEGESINPNTGTLQITKALTNLQGVSPGTDLTLKLVYNPGTHGTFGLPSNWGLDLPYVLPGRSITASGRTYAIDPDWSDSSNYHSGLKYLNNHGMKFEHVNPPQDLPSKQPGSYEYKLQHPDGSVDYFDAFGKPIEHDDIVGNYLYFRYDPAGENETVLSPQSMIDYVLDSWRQKITFQYHDQSELTVVLPDQSKSAVMYNSEQVTAVVDAAGYKTSFEYVRLYEPSQLVISEITYPSGLISRFEYIGIPFIGATNEEGQLAAVSNHWQYENTTQVVKHVNYRYGTLSNGFFTGFNRGCRMGTDGDSLMDGNYPDYSYDVLVIHNSEEGVPLSATCTWFNYLHLPVKEHRRNIDSQGNLNHAYQAVFSYTIDENAHARTPNYMNPAVIEQFHILDTQAETYQPMSKKSFEYSDHGHVTSIADELYTSNGVYQKQKTMKREYETVSRTPSWQTQMLIKESTTDETLKVSSITQHTLTDDKKLVQKTTIGSSQVETNGAFSNPRLWQERHFTYDAQGRLLSEMHAWSPEATPPKDTITSTTIKTAYKFEEGVLTEYKYDAMNNASIAQRDMRKPGGPNIKNVLPLGQIETFAYDELGRLTSHKDFLGNITRTDYKVAPNDNSQVVVSPRGHVKRTSFDVLGRTKIVVDNGDHSRGVQSGKVDRTISQSWYDCLSRIVRQVDINGVSTLQTYDGLGRPMQTTDGNENVILRQYDDTRLTVRKSINGALRSMTKLNGLARVIEEITYPDAEDAISPVLVRAHQYDGLGRIVAESLSKSVGALQGDLPASTSLIEKQMWKFDSNSRVANEVKIGYLETGRDTISRDYVRDLFGNLHTYNKKAIYSDGRTFSHNGPQKFYNQANQLTKLRNQIGQEETYTYNENGWLVETCRFDGSKFKSLHDAAGRPTTITTPTGSRLSYYLEDGLISKTQEGDQIMTYTYSVDGTLTSITFGDGRSQTFTLDKSSRVVKETDVFGVVRETVFDEKGQVKARSCRDDIVSYAYGTANNTKGQLIQASINGKRSHTSKVIYDGYGRLSHVNVCEAHSDEHLVSTEYAYSAKGQIVSVKSSSKNFPSLNTERTYTYDGLGQVTQESVKGASSSAKSYRYDGNSNVVSVVSNDDGKAKTLTYNAIDQRIDGDFKWDKNGRLVHDDNGRQYTFDDQDRLILVTSANRQKTSRFAYHSDNSISQLNGSLQNSKLYGNGQRINAMESKAHQTEQSSQNSFFTGGQSLIASYSNTQDPIYFLDQAGSTTLLLEQANSTTLAYDAYGLQQNQTQDSLHKSFGFNQELTDPDSGLVYMQSRFYYPEHMGFVSMDSYTKENRYSFCSGDPINFVDPSGHSEGSIIGWVLGIAAAVVAGVLTGGLADVALAPVLGATAASIAAGTLGGAAGNAAAGLVYSAVAGTPYSASQFGMDLATGAIGGLAGTGAAVAAVSRGASIVTASTIAGGVGGLVQGSVASILAGERLDAWQIALSAATGAAMGAISGRWYFKRNARIQELIRRNQEARAQMLQELQQQQPMRPRGSTADSINFEAEPPVLRPQRVDWNAEWMPDPLPPVIEVENMRAQNWRSFERQVWRDMMLEGDFNPTVYNARLAGGGYH